MSLLLSYCFVHAPFPCFLFGLLLALPWSSALCSAQILSVLLSVSLVVLWSLASVALRGSWDCVVFVLLLVRLAVLLVFVAFLAVLEWALLLLLLSALLCCVFFSVLFAFPPLRVVSFGALVQLVPWRAGTSLWVSGCSCDGLVALPSCWECG